MGGRLAAGRTGVREVPHLKIAINCLWTPHSSNLIFEIEIHRPIIYWTEPVKTEEEEEKKTHTKKRE